MIEYTIAEVLADACSLTLSDDLWCGAFPPDVDEGVCVSVVYDINRRETHIGEARLAIYVVKPLHYDCRELADSIVEALNSYRGMDTWVTSDNGAIAYYKGVNTIGYHLYTVYVTINKE